MQVDIFGMDHNGNGLGRINEKIVFVPKSIPGDKCLIKLIKDHKTYSIGRIEKVVEQGSNRKEVECPYYYICGGCNISNLSYSEQLKFKKDKVKNIFKQKVSEIIEWNSIKGIWETRANKNNLKKYFLRLFVWI